MERVKRLRALFYFLGKYVVLARHDGDDRVARCGAGGFALRQRRPRAETDGKKPRYGITYLRGVTFCGEPPTIGNEGISNQPQPGKRRWGIVAWHTQPASRGARDGAHCDKSLIHIMAIGLQSRVRQFNSDRRLDR